MVRTIRASEAVVERIANEAWAEVQLTPLESDAIEQVVAAAIEFFRSPQAMKDTCQIASGVGYRPYGIEYSKASDRPDDMETFSATAASSAHAFDVSVANDLNRACAGAFRELERLAEAIIASLARRVTDRCFEAALAGGLHRWSTLQINYSRPNEVRSAFINEEHEDGHFLTLGYATASGLEVRRPSGDFLAIAPAQCHVIAMLGGAAALMTDGRLRPLFHQVRSPEGCEERVSVLFFADLAPELCQPWIVGDANCHVDIGGYVRANPLRFGLKG
ncbi:2OG-Fe(II) oxygenase family protein [Bradyrhizobium sp. USDA 4451]